MGTSTNRNSSLKSRRLCALALTLASLVANVVTAADKNWPHYGGSSWNGRHAELKLITKKNVNSLVPRRVLQLGHIGASLSASPLVIDGILYVSMSDNILQAFDVRSGMRKWFYQHKMDLSGYKVNTKPSAGGAILPACCSNQSRGVAFANGIVFLATLDAKVIAIDAETGKQMWEVWGVRPDWSYSGFVDTLESSS